MELPTSTIPNNEYISNRVLDLSLDTIRITCSEGYPLLTITGMSHILSSLLSYSSTGCPSFALNSDFREFSSLTSFSISANRAICLSIFNVLHRAMSAFIKQDNLDSTYFSFEEPLLTDWSTLCFSASNKEILSVVAFPSFTTLLSALWMCAKFWARIENISLKTFLNELVSTFVPSEVDYSFPSLFNLKKGLVIDQRLLLSALTVSERYRVENESKFLVNNTGIKQKASFYLFVSDKEGPSNDLSSSNSPLINYLFLSCKIFPLLSDPTQRDVVALYFFQSLCFNHDSALPSLVDNYSFPIHIDEVMPIILQEEQALFRFCNYRII